MLFYLFFTKKFYFTCFSLEVGSRLVPPRATAAATAARREEFPKVSRPRSHCAQGWNSPVRGNPSLRFFSQHLVFGSPFLLSLSAYTCNAGTHDFYPPLSTGPMVVVIVIPPQPITFQQDLWGKHQFP